MAKYLLTGINDDDWKLFKADCDLQGITIKEAFIEYINIVVSTFKKHPEYSKLEPMINKWGGKKK